MADKKVLIIAGLWYSGTSLLNAFLDSQNGVRGIGEGYHIYTGTKNCFCSCGQWLSACPFYADVSSTAFYRDCFSKYGCDTLVDASKDAAHFAQAEDTSLSYGTVFLSKSPHAWLYSHRKHNPKDGKSLDVLIDYYIAFYQQHIDRAYSKEYPVFSLTYEQLVAKTDDTISQLCSSFDIPFSGENLKKCWQTDTHIAGGNEAVFHQIRSDDWFIKRSKKYADKKGSIFLDDAWKNDVRFLLGCADLYERKRKDLEPLLASIGQPEVSALLQELQKNINASSAT